MFKYLFLNDYSEGCHPSILEALAQTNFDQEEGYGNDRLSVHVAEVVRRMVAVPDAGVHFVSGGTQANVVVLASILKPFESVIAVNTGHINIHEAGAIEATGHHIHSVDSPNGKLTVPQISSIVDTYADEHMVKPRAVFVSQATEMGTIYTKKELEDISVYCRAHNLFLYLDGARLGSGLASKNADLTFQDIAALVDVFYIGGTKNGALLGEVIVIPNPTIQADFRYHMKQRGALLAKGRIIAAQFAALLSADRYMELAHHANAMAETLSQGIKEAGFSFQSESTTNQIFPIFENTLIENLKNMYGFYIWAKIDETHSSIRLVTSWATKKEHVYMFLEDLKSIVGK
jgi:threonine aldolase